MFSTCMVMAVVAGMAHHPQDQPDAVVLSVGVNKQEQPGNDLNWLAQNAKDQDAFWKTQEGKLFRKVSCTLLINEQATGANIRREMKAVEARVKRGDFVIVPFSGHGTDPSESEWMFCAFDGHRPEGRLLLRDFKEWTSRLSEKGVRVVLMFESCFSGSLLTMNVPNVVVIASSQAGEPSLDDGPFMLKGNGLLNKALFEAFGGKADVNGDGMVSLGEATDFLKKRVPQLAGHFQFEQRPAISLGGLSAETPLASVKRTAKGLVVPALRPNAR